MIENNRLEENLTFQKNDEGVFSSNLPSHERKS